MDNNLSPEQNEYVEEEIIENEISEEEETVEDYTPSSNNSNNDKDEFRAKIIKMFSIVLIGLVVILIIGFIISLVTKKDYNYASVEDVMKDAAVDYFKDNKNKLPKNNSEIVEIDTTILANNKYMKTLDKYLKNEECTGKVVVKMTDDSLYSYTPQLTCGDKYTTTKFYSKIANPDNVVTEGFGIYYINNEYVYRGSDVDNYVRFSDSEILWRVVKVTNTNEVVLISNEETRNKFVWDERYNSMTEDNSGINTFKNSNISNILDKVYKNKLNSDENEYYRKEEIKFLTKDNKSKLVDFAACVGTRSKIDATKNGVTECSVTENVKMSLLSTNDFINASTDINCTSTTKPDCQNYNYLNTNTAYWLGNGAKEESNKIYYITGSGYIRTNHGKKQLPIRVVVHLGEDAMLESGTGTIEKPYIIR